MTPRPTGSDRFTLVSYLVYGIVGWSMSGMGAVLPQLRDTLGGVATVYPSLPGAGLLLLGLGLGRRRGPTPAAVRPDRGSFMITWRTAAHVAGLALMALAGRGLPSLTGALLMGLTAASLIRFLPSALQARHRDRSVEILTRANAWSSLASIASPLTVGAAIWLGLGWQLGLVVAPVAGTAALLVLHRAPARPGAPAEVTVEAPRPDPAAAIPTPSPLPTASGLPVASPLPTPSPGPVADRLRPLHPIAGGDRVDTRPRSPWPGMAAWLLLTLSIVVEFAFVYFAATYLREDVGMSAAASAAGAAAFAIGMASGRFLAGPVPQLGSQPLPVHLAVIGLGFALMWLLPTPVTAVAGIAVAGLGSALLYPIGIVRLLGCFGHDPGRGASLGGLASGVALLSSPALLGTVRALSDVRIAYLSVPLLLAVLVAIDRLSRQPAPERALTAL